MHFESITQYDEKYKGIEGYSSGRNACGIFSLLVAETFIKGTQITVHNYEKILDSAVQIVTRQNIKGMQSFNELMLQQHSYKSDDLTFATADLLASDPENYRFFFPQDKDKYATILLKNSTFFAICSDTKNNYYGVFDCHQLEQYTFNSYPEMIAHLNQRYNMDEIMIIDGVALHEFSSIEGLVIDKTMKCVFDTNLHSLDNKVNSSVDEPKPYVERYRSPSPVSPDIFRSAHQFVQPKNVQQYDFNFS